jgi:hypothetical protein
MGRKDVFTIHPGLIRLTQAGGSKAKRLRIYLEDPEVQRAARGEAEQKAARRLAVDPHDLAIVAFAQWGRSLTEERDARVAALSDISTTPRTTQARRGHVTRLLLDELEPKLKKGN